MERTNTIRIKGTWLRYLTVVVVSVVAAAPTAVWASNTFTDVPDTNVFHDDIDWMVDSGVTLGCGDGEYCPDEDVLRQQMVAFMHRLADNQVVDAGHLEGFSAVELAPRAAFDSSNNLDEVEGMVLSATIDAPAAGF